MSCLKRAEWCRNSSSDVTGVAGKTTMNSCKQKVSCVSVNGTAVINHFVVAVLPTPTVQNSSLKHLPTPILTIHVYSISYLIYFFIFNLINIYSMICNSCTLLKLIYKIFNTVIHISHKSAKHMQLMKNIGPPTFIYSFVKKVNAVYRI